MTGDIERRIRERAYEIWESEGRPEGRSEDHWKQARAEFGDAAAEARQDTQVEAAGDNAVSKPKRRRSASGTAAPKPRRESTKSAAPVKAATRSRRKKPEA